MSMELVFPAARAIHGTVVVPGDKSVTHRAYLLAGVAEGTSPIRGANTGADCAATLAAVAALGARVERTADGTVSITGQPGPLAAPAAALDLGNSGTGLRLLAGLLVGRDVAVRLVGDASLSARPMRRIVEPLRTMGARITAEGAGETPPLVLEPAGSLRATTWPSPVASAQVKSAVLLAGLAAHGRTAVREPAPSRDHTERILPAFGVTLVRDGGAVAIDGPVVPRAASIDVPGDISAAAFWIVAATVAEEGELRLPGIGINPTRDGLLRVLERMGARIERSDERTVGDEPVADLLVRPAALRGVDVGPAEIPALVDELPVLAIAQALATGRSTVRGAGELRVKESDRIAHVVKGLRALGAKVDELEDGWSIEGGTLTGGAVDAVGDHRLAMAFGIASLGANGAIRVAGAGMIDTSYPGFYHAFKDRVQER